MSKVKIEKLKSSISEVAPDYGIKKVDLFGSYAAGKESAESDIDLLIEFNQKSVSYLKIINLKNRLEKMIGKSVDLIHAPIPPESFLVVNKVVPIYGY